jgi:hypothetical protein
MARPGASSLYLRLPAAAMLAVEIAIHAYLAPEHLSEIPYIGASFEAASVLLAVTVVGIAVAPRSSAPWMLGALLCIGMAFAFLASRTVGLPGYHEQWTSDSGLGLYALAPEVVFLLCGARALGILPSRAA